MNFKKLFLPLGIVLAVGVSLLINQPGLWLRAHKAVYALVVIIFLLNGWSFNIDQTGGHKKLLPVLGGAALLSLLLSPIAATGLCRLLGLHNSLDTGLIVMASMPTTLSSAIVITSVLGGNRGWAMFLTVGLNLISILSVPLLLPFLIDLVDGVDTGAAALLVKMLLLVLLPFGCGLLLRRFVKPVKMINSYLPSVCVIAIVYAAFCAAGKYLSNFDYSLLPLLLAGVLIIHCGLIALSWGGSKLCGMQTNQRIALILCTSQKTLPMAISVITAAGLDNGLILLPCLLYYFIQLTLDTLILHHLCPVRGEEAA